MGNVILSASASPTGWRTAFQTDTPIPASFALTFDVTTNGWGVVVNKHAAGSTYWLVGVTTSNVPFVSKYNGSTYTDVAIGVDVYTAPGSIMLWFGEVRYGNNEDLWLVTSLWSNGRMLVSYAEQSALSINDTMNFGLATRHSSTTTFNNIRIPEMTEIAEAETIDPGETAMSALGRIIEGRNLKYFVRHNRTFRAWKPKAQLSVFVLDNNVEAVSRDENPHIVKTHVRQVGAYDYAEVVRPDLIKTYGHSFAEINNPFIMSEADCYAEGQRAILRLMEQALVDTLVDSFLQFVEVEDRITTIDGERLISSLSTEYTPVQVVHTIVARNYVYD